MPIGKIELDITTAGGCNDPDCKDPLCKKQGDEMFFHQNCHRMASLHASSVPGSRVANFFCSACHKLVVAVNIMEEPRLSDMMPFCHPHSPVEACYNRGTGIIEIMCTKCRGPVGQLRVAI